jgi:hypothetical protein
MRPPPAWFKGDVNIIYMMAAEFHRRPAAIEKGHPQAALSCHFMPGSIAAGHRVFTAWSAVTADICKGSATKADPEQAGKYYGPHHGTPFLNGG